MTKILNPPDVAKRRLQVEYKEVGSYGGLADKYDVNVRYIWEFLTAGIIPVNKTVCKRLGIAPPATPAQLLTRARNLALRARAIERGWPSMSAIMTAFIDDENVVMVNAKNVV